MRSKLGPKQRTRKLAPADELEAFAGAKL
jgi:hypothetical protein